MTENMLLRFKAKNHPQQKTQSWVDDHQLPDGEFWVLNKRFSFSVDVAAAKHNARCEKYYTREDDGLSKSWAGERVYCNPPYSDIGPWCEKAWMEVGAEIIVMLLPANRTEQGWWQTHIEPKRDRPDSPLKVEFLPGRIRFLKPGQALVGANERPPFGSVLCIWNWKDLQ